MRRAAAKKLSFKTIERIGTEAFGHRWIAPLAEAISRVTGRNVAGPQISHWKSGLRPIPDWVEVALLQVAKEELARKLDTAAQLRVIANSLQDRLMNAISPELSAVSK